MFTCATEISNRQTGISNRQTTPTNQPTYSYEYTHVHMCYWQRYKYKDDKNVEMDWRTNIQNRVKSKTSNTNNSTTKASEKFTFQPVKVYCKFLYYFILFFLATLDDVHHIAM